MHQGMVIKVRTRVNNVKISLSYDIYDSCPILPEDGDTKMCLNPDDAQST